MPSPVGVTVFFVFFFYTPAVYFKACSFHLRWCENSQSCCLWRRLLFSPPGWVQEAPVRPVFLPRPDTGEEEVWTARVEHSIRVQRNWPSDLCAAAAHVPGTVPGRQFSTYSSFNLCCTYDTEKYHHKSHSFFFFCHFRGDTTQWKYCAHINADRKCQC